MLQAVKGNEGGYSGLLFYNHPKTHPWINEGAGGRLISLFCVTVGACGVGHSRLKPAPTPLATWQHSQVGCWATPSLLDLSQVCPAWARHVWDTVKSHLSAETDGTFIHKNNKPVIIHLKPVGQFQWLCCMLTDPVPLVGVKKNTCCDVLLRMSVHISILYNRITDAGNMQSESRHHGGLQIQWPSSHIHHHLQTFQNLDNLSMTLWELNQVNTSWYLKELCILSTKVMQHINMLTNIEFSQASLLQMQHQFADIYVVFIIIQSPG